MAKASKARRTAIGELVTANHILYNQGILDAYGHVAVRDPDDPQRFLLARHMAPGIVTADDIITFDFDCNVIEGSRARPYTERWIYSAVFAARPDVNGIVHTHSHSLVPYGTTRTPLKPLWAPAAFLGFGVAQFDTRDIAGDTDLMIRDAALGRALAAALGDRPVVLMRGHGGTVVGKSLREAVYRAIYIEANAKIDTAARGFENEPIYMSEGEARLSQAHHDTDPSYRRVWEFWSSLVEDDDD
jgi:HCOMODA/2-hydroxy-3-carboxy-muconic semialdehyde decarboxylase